MVFIVSCWLLAPSLPGPLVASLSSGNPRSGGPSREMLLAMRRREKAELGTLVFCRRPLKTFGRLTGGCLFTQVNEAACPLCGCCWGAGSVGCCSSKGCSGFPVRVHSSNKTLSGGASWCHFCSNTPQAKMLQISTLLIVACGIPYV